MRETLLARLGIVVRRIRIDLRLSQEQLAERVGLHRTYVGGIERGERNISIRSLERLAAALDLPMSGLLRRVEHEELAATHPEGEKQRAGTHRKCEGPGH